MANIWKEAILSGQWDEELQMIVNYLKEFVPSKRDQFYDGFAMSTRLGIPLWVHNALIPAAYELKHPLFARIARVRRWYPNSNFQFANDGRCYPYGITRSTDYTYMHEVD